MEIREFKVETWLNPRTDKCRYNFGSSCVKAFTVGELFEFLNLDVTDFLTEVRNMSLHYGHFFGLERLLEALSKMYEDVTGGMILSMHGGTGANNAVITELLRPGCNVVAFIPNYQQHYSIPESLGAEVRRLELREENGYLPDLAELEALVDRDTAMITLSNPNNPSGSFIGRDMMKRICGLADRYGAYVLSDEIYRGLGDEYMPSVVDVYERGVATCSTSKVFSMAGTRVGWIVTRDAETYRRLENRRSYDTICNGVFDELVTAIALENYGRILERNRGIVRENRAVFDSWLKDRPYLSCSNKSYTSTAFVKYDPSVFDKSATELCTDIFENAETLLCHGDCFEIPHSFRLGYGYVDSPLVSEGLDALGSYLDRLAGSKG